MLLLGFLLMVRLVVRFMLRLMVKLMLWLLLLLGYCRPALLWHFFPRGQVQGGNGVAGNYGVGLAGQPPHILRDIPNIVSVVAEYSGRRNICFQFPQLTLRKLIILVPEPVTFSNSFHCLSNDASKGRPYLTATDQPLGHTPSKEVNVARMTV